MKWLPVAALAALAFAAFGQNTLDECYKILKANPKSSMASYGIGEIQFREHSYQAAANGFRNALKGDLEPKWTEVWSYINIGKIFDITGQRDRAIAEYKLALQTNDDTRGALTEAAKLIQSPYVR